MHTILAALSGILRQAVEDEHLEHNPATRLGRYTKRQPAEDEARERVKYWTEGQLGRVLARIKEDYPEWHDLFAAMAWGGFRVGEAVGLQWDDVDQAGNSKSS